MFAALNSLLCANCWCAIKKLLTHPEYCMILV